MRAFVRNGFRTRTVLFYPDLPYHRHYLYKLCHFLGYRMSKDPSVRACLTVHFRDITKKEIDPTLARLQDAGRYIVNYGCTDISKSRVDEAFREVFGYSAAIDPLIHEGKYVRKSERNATHDGQIFDMPMAPQAGYVYQILIDTEREGRLQEYRVPLVGDSIPFVFRCDRELSDRFTDNALLTVAETRELLSKEEVAKTISVCRKLGVDFGSLDILRDRDRRIYIVDVNDTPSGIYASRGKAHVADVLSRMGAALQALIESQPEAEANELAR
jgi:hypothetical protein